MVIRGPLIPRPPAWARSLRLVVLDLVIVAVAAALGYSVFDLLRTQLSGP